jgi:LacI family transcriptional regulator
MAHDDSELGAEPSADPGRHVTLRAIADELGLNVSTVSRALSKDRGTLVSAQTRARVLEVAERMGYRENVQARGLRTGRTGTIGVIVPDLGNPFNGPVLRGIENALGGRGHLPIVAESRDIPGVLQRVCDQMLSQRVDGVITTAGRLGDRAILRRLADRIPTVLAVRNIPGSGIPAVSHDDEMGGRIAAEHLISLGHQRVAQLHGPMDISSFRGRSAGFVGTAIAHGLDVIDVDESIALPTIESGKRLTQTLLDMTMPDPPTAVFAHNDSIAVGARVVLGQYGLAVPTDISLIGYNNGPLTDYLSPPLTTIRLPGYELGRLAAEMVVSLIEGAGTSAESVSVAPGLVVRASTAPPRSKGLSALLNRPNI